MTKKILYLFLIAYTTFSFSNDHTLFVPVDGAELFCKVMGEGDPIVVIHGGPGLRHDYLTPSLEKLAENHLVVFYDQRASGLSTGEVNRETMKVSVFIHDLEALRSYFGFEKMTLLGHSWGAALGIKYALDYPEFVDKLILVSAPPLSWEEGALASRALTNRSKIYFEERKAIEASEAYLRGDTATLERYIKIRCNAHFYDPSKAIPFYYLLNLETLRTREKIDKVFMMLEFCNSPDFYPLLDSIQIPALILHGDSDFIPSSIAEKIHKHLLNSHYVLLEQCGHALTLEKPEESLQAIKEFLENDR